MPFGRQKTASRRSGPAGTRRKPDTQKPVGRRVLRGGRFQRSSIVSSLDFASNLRAIRIAAVQQQFSRAQPARIQVGEIAARLIVTRRVLLLIRNQDALDIEQHAGHQQQRNTDSSHGPMNDHFSIIDLPQRHRGPERGIWILCFDFHLMCSLCALCVSVVNDPGTARVIERSKWLRQLENIGSRTRVRRPS